MALTVATVQPHAGVDVWGSVRIARTRVTFDASYATGGESFNADLYLPNATVQAVEVIPRPVLGSPNTAYEVQYDHTNKKLLAFWVDTTVDGAPFAEVASTTDLSGLVVDIIIYGS